MDVRLGLAVGAVEQVLLERDGAATELHLLLEHLGVAREPLIQVVAHAIHPAGEIRVDARHQALRREAQVGAHGRIGRG